MLSYRMQDFSRTEISVVWMDISSITGCLEI